MEAPWAGGVVLLVCVGIAMLLANLPLTAEYYHHLLQTDLSLAVHSPDGVIDWVYPRGMTVEKLINDGLMVIFFFSVGLEIKREIISGQLSTLRKAILPVLGAAGGAQHRKNRLAERRELPRDDFALDFEADREEEDDHQAVVNQLLDGHAARIDPVDDPVGAVDRQREVGLQQMVVVLRREGEVGQQHGNSDADEQHYAARPGRLHETTAPQP